MKEGDEMDVEKSFEKALEAARKQGACMLYGDRGQGDGLRALVYPDPNGGARMCMFEGKDLLMAFTAVETPGEPFEPSAGLGRMAGSLCEAIEKAPLVPREDKSRRVWRTWVEMFEGLALVDLAAASGEPEKTAEKRARFSS